MGTLPCTYPKFCRKCKRRFFASVVNTKVCRWCKKKEICHCGCRSLVKTPGRLYASGHHPNTRSKEAHKKQGKKISGGNNPAKKRWVRKKISVGVSKNHWTHLYPKKARQHAKAMREKGLVGVSQLERDFQKIISKKFKYQVVIGVPTQLILLVNAIELLLKSKVVGITHVKSATPRDPSTLSNEKQFT